MTETITTGGSILPFTPDNEALMLELGDICDKQDALRDKWFSTNGGTRKRTQTEYNRYEELQERATFLREEIRKRT